MKYWLCLICCGLLNALAHAAPPDAWKEMTFSYQEEQRTVGHFLNVFAQAFGVRTQVNHPSLLDKSLSGGQHISGTPLQVLERLSSVYGFQWYVYRNVLYISDHNLDRTEYIPLKGVTPQQAKQALTAAGLFEVKFGWAEFDLGKRSAVLVSGPRSYLTLLHGVLNRISVEDPDQEERRVMVFPLRYASAIDVEIPTRDGSAVRPGVASTLKKLLTPNQGSWTSEIPMSSGLHISKSLGSLTSVGDAPTSAPRALPSLSNPFGGSNPLSPFNMESNEEQPVIEAYAALNAVIVRDRPSKSPVYEQIFRTLDVPARRVELVVTIVDVDVNTLDEWMPQISVGGAKNKISIQSSGGVDIAATGNVVLVSTTGLAVALKNSESQGQARIQSRPSVMTLDNLSAILDLSQTAYFKLVGERTADVKSVTVGTRLKVIPRILGYAGNADLHVQIELEDGSLQAQSENGDITQSRSSLIATQAIISPGQSLLIGGYRRDANEKTNSQVPGFSTIPIVGALFKSETNQHQRVERLFVLSARVMPDTLPPVSEHVKQLDHDLILP